MLPTLFIAFILSCVSSLAQNFYLFVSLRFLHGFFISGSSATIFVYISEFFDNKIRNRAIMTSAMFYGISLVLVPMAAWLVINQDWKFDIPLINITYKPWRSWLIMCSLPGFISFLILLFLPESPKFVLAQGDRARAYEILQKMHRINSGHNSEFEKFEILEEPESIANRQRILSCKESSFPLLKSIWNQTAPLFERQYLFSTMLMCSIQFGIYTTSNGVYILATEILNKMASNLDNFTNQRMAMCEAINMQPANLTLTDHEATNNVCITKLETTTIQQEIVLEAIFAVGCVIVSLLVNRLGRFPILFSILFICGASGYVAMLTDIPWLQICAFLSLLTCGLSNSIVNACTVELYPTSSRAMAICVSLMFGRLGCFVGANAAALLIESHCESLFYLSGSTILVIAVLSYFIPNIHSKSNDKPMMQIDPRLSVISMR